MPKRIVSLVLAAGLSLLALTFLIQQTAKAQDVPYILEGGIIAVEGSVKFGETITTANDFRLLSTLWRYDPSLTETMVISIPGKSFWAPEVSSGLVGWTFNEIAASWILTGTWAESGPIEAALHIPPLAAGATEVFTVTSTTISSDFVQRAVVTVTHPLQNLLYLPLANK